jgi:hypothetical protein
MARLMEAMKSPLARLIWAAISSGHLTLIKVVETIDDDHLSYDLTQASTNNTTNARNKGWAAALDALPESVLKRVIEAHGLQEQQPDVGGSSGFMVTSAEAPRNDTAEDELHRLSMLDASIAAGNSNGIPVSKSMSLTSNRNTINSEPHYRTVPNDVMGVDAGSDYGDSGATSMGTPRQTPATTPIRADPGEADLADELAQMGFQMCTKLVSDTANRIAQLAINGMVTKATIACRGAYRRQRAMDFRAIIEENMQVSYPCSNAVLTLDSAPTRVDDNKRN